MTAHTVDDLKEKAASADREEVEQMLADEEAGDNRKGAIEALERRLADLDEEGEGGEAEADAVEEGEGSFPVREISEVKTTSDQMAYGPGGILQKDAAGKTHQVKQVKTNLGS